MFVMVSCENKAIYGPKASTTVPLMNLAPIRQLLPRLGAVVAGGFLGGSVRYVVTVLLSATTPSADVDWAWSAFDVRLLLVNSLGVALAVGLVLGPLRERSADDPLRLLVLTGGLGGLTTYSSLIFELGRMWQTSPLAAVLGGLLSLGCGAVAAAGAVLLVRRRVSTRAEL